MSNIYPLDKLPGQTITLLKALAGGKKKAGNSLPDIGYSVDHLAADEKQLSAYSQMFNFGLKTVPSTYWYIYLFRLQSHLMLHPKAPFPLPGMIHLYFKINQYQPILPQEKLTAVCRFGKLIQHDKGTIVETIMSLYKNGNLIWEQKNYNLYRSKVSLGDPAEDKPEIEITSPNIDESWVLNSKNAIAYAKVSGDFNPIHLSHLTAKAFGFPHQLIHGWYTLSRCIASLQSSLSDAHEIYGSFKKPLFLPNEVTWRSQENEGSTLFEVINIKEGFPHLKGYVLNS